MDIKNYVVLFLLLISCGTATETVDICPVTLATASPATKRTNETCSHVQLTGWIEKQINGTVDICSEILGPKGKKDSGKKQNLCPRLVVWVPKKSFAEFVDINNNGELKGGFSIAIFCLALQELPFTIQPIFVTLDDQNGGSYDLLIPTIENKTCEAIAGDITITGNRTKYVDFTIPYMSSEIYMLVPSARNWNQTLLTLAKPFTPGLWLAIILGSIFTGIMIEILESRARNPEFRVPFCQKLIMVIWFPVSTFFFHEGRIHNRNSKVVLVIWLATFFIVIQIYTACLSSWLTVNQLHPKVPKNYHVVGFQNGSCVEDFATNYMKSSSTVARLQPLSSIDEYKKVLDKGTVDAIFEELPYIDIFIAKYGDTYKKVGPLADEPGFGIAFSRGSELQQEFSRAVVNVTESKDMIDMKKKYFGIQIPVPTKPDDSSPQSLDAQSFILLFVCMGLGTIVAFVSSELSLRRTQAQVSPVTSGNTTSPDPIVSANPNQIAES